jgi:hypothetical protein
MTSFHYQLKVIAPFGYATPRLPNLESKELKLRENNFLTAFVPLCFSVIGVHLRSPVVSLTLWRAQPKSARIASVALLNFYAVL